MYVVVNIALFIITKQQKTTQISISSMMNSGVFIQWNITQFWKWMNYSLPAARNIKLENIMLGYNVGKKQIIEEYTTCFHLYKIQEHVKWNNILIPI